MKTKPEYELNPLLRRVITKEEAGQVLSAFLQWPLTVIDDGEDGVVVKVENIDQLDQDNILQLLILQELHMQSEMVDAVVEELRYTNHMTMLAIFMDGAVGDLIPWYDSNAPLIADIERRAEAMETLFADFKGGIDSVMTAPSAESLEAAFQHLIDSRNAAAKAKLIEGLG